MKAYIHGGEFMKIIVTYLSFFLLNFAVSSVYGKTFYVGPARQYTLPSQVSSLVSDGDTVAIDAGEYTDCATWNANDLVLVGIGDEYAHIENQTCLNKGVWVLFGNNTIIENIELSGAYVDPPDGSNGAGIRAQGGSLTVRHCYIHGNQMGILASMTDSANVLIENSIIADNISLDTIQFAHNIYINTCDTFTLRYCYVHGAYLGHNVKSRARKNFILYNRITDETDTASRDIDLPNGGQAFVIGNIIEKGPNAPNTNTLEFGYEGMINPGPQNLFIASNTLINDLPARGIFIGIPSSGFDTLVVDNNIFAGPGVLLTGTPRLLDSNSNLVTQNISTIRFQDPGNFHYQLQTGSPAIDAGRVVGTCDGFSLMPQDEYRDTANFRARTIAGKTVDIGAFEYLSEDNINETDDFVTGLRVFALIDHGATQAEISVENTGASGAEITCCDILGREVAKFHNVTSNVHVIIRTQAMPDGEYFIHATSSNGSALSRMTIIH